MALTPSVDRVDTTGPYFDIAYTLYTTPDSHIYHRENPINKGANALTYATARAPNVESEERDREKQIALNDALSGIDPHDRTYHVITEEEMRTFVTQSLANITGSFGGYDNREYLSGIINSLVFLDLFTNAQLNSRLVGANIGQVNGWTNWINGLNTSVTTYVQGIPEQVPS